MSSDARSHDAEMASVLIVDIVGYTLHTIDRKTALVSDLQTIVKDCAKSVRARAPGDWFPYPTGDGMILVFFRNPVLPAQCALEIAGALGNHPEIAVRMGIHMGPVFRHLDIKEQVGVLGGGVDMAQRTMDCGDAGHILVSHSVAEVLEQFDEWRECLLDLGVHEVKHGARVHLYNLCKGGLGNRETPRKISVTVEMLPGAGAAPSKFGAKSRWKWILAGSVVALLAGGGIVVQRSGIVHFGATPPISPVDRPKVSPVGPAAATVTVADAMPVYITLDGDVPSDGSGGPTLSFTVRDDLKVGDNVIVAKGAKVSGAIVWGKRILGMLGKKMNFRLMQAEAVDGQKLNIRATLKHAGKSADSRPFDTGKGSKFKEWAAIKGTEYIGYFDGDQSVSIRR